MLRKWSLSNFKSFKGKTELKLAPITVLAGANSSGKSTIIQSILLLKQTIQYVPTTRAIGLNGPLLKLGRFEDIKNISTESDVIEIGWELDQISAYRGAASAPLYYYAMHSSDELRSASFSMAFGLGSESSLEAQAVPSVKQSWELRQLQPALQSFTMTINFNGVEEGKTIQKVAEIRIRGSSPKVAVRDAIEDTSIRAEARQLLRYYVSHLDTQSRAELIQQRPQASVVGASARHFFPFQVGVIFNKTKDLAQKVAAVVASLQPAEKYYYDSTMRTAVLPKDWIRFVLEIVRQAIPTAPSAGENDSPVLFDTRSAARILEGIDRFDIKEMASFEFVSNLQQLTFRADSRLRTLIRSALTENQDVLEKKFLEEARLSDEMSLDVGIPRTIYAGVERGSAFLQHAIHYLGPLRDEPRPVYPLEALINPTDVGYRGEHTAAVLDLHRDRPVQYIRSCDVDNLISATPQQASLHIAVVDWLSYLGVAERVQTTDLGMIGHQVQVRTGDVSKDHDLTNVGVGVSQLLPIIVMALLAPSPSFLIFEQPELHLHPKVQARLADFFLSLGLSGRQCLLETHSEYLVDRLRRRIAEAEGDSLVDAIKIYFTQKVSGNTVCTPIELSPYGAIKNWPSDFFDQSQAETAELLSAAQRKLRRDRERAVIQK